MVRVSGDEGQRFIDNPCEAHAMIEDYSLEQNNKGGTNLKVTFTLLAATDRAQVGKSMSQIFPLDGGGVAKLWDLLEATRIVDHGTNRKQQLDFDETLLKGRQCVIKVHLERGQTMNNVTGKYEDDPSKPEYARIGFQAIHDVRDAKVAAVPKDPQLLATWPELPGGQPAPTQPQKPTQPPQQNLPLTGQGDTATSMNW
jgi:hypothetical protein